MTQDEIKLFQKIIKEEINTAVDQVNKRLDDPETGLASINARLDDPETGLASINARLDDPESGLGSINKRLDDPETGLQAINDNVGILVADVDHIKTTTKATYELLGGSIDRQQKEINEIKDRIGLPVAEPN